jgi:hypothetical protein
MKTLLAAIVLIVGTVAASGSALARTDNPFRPDHFNNQNPSASSVGAESGIPWQYRVGK